MTVDTLIKVKNNWPKNPSISNSLTGTFRLRSYLWICQNQWKRRRKVDMWSIPLEAQTFLWIRKGRSRATFRASLSQMKKLKGLRVTLAMLTPVERFHIQQLDISRMINCSKLKGGVRLYSRLEPWGVVIKGIATTKSRPAPSKRNPCLLISNNS